MKLNKNIMDVRERARKHALLNAAKFKGKAQLGTVLGKVMSEVDSDIKEVMPIVKEAVDQVNQYTLREQEQEISKLNIKVKKTKKKKKQLPLLPQAVQGNVITRFPPEPNGYLHIGHAKAAFIDYEYAQIYDGTFILRFDDTNPLAEQKKFYDIQKNDLKWLGITWDKEYRTSDNLPTHYDYAKDLLENENAYICSCSEQDIKSSRKHMKRCDCYIENKDRLFDEFKKMNEGEAIIRLKADISSLNTAMRDPTLFRIIDYPHPIHGKRYQVWPTYDFYGAIEDSISGVTHPFRSKEYELRDEAYYYLLDCLNLRKPCLMEFSRLDILGMPVSKRKIKPLIEQNVVNGWDDPRLPTLVAMRRRGFVPNAIKEFVLSQGISKAESIITFENVEAINKKHLDPKVRRYFFVPNPIKLVVKDAPHRNIILKSHPSGSLGHRDISTGDVFYIPRDDVSGVALGQMFRLKDLYNVMLEERTESVLYGTYSGDAVVSRSEKVQWVTEDYHSVSVLLSSPLYVDNKLDDDSLRTVNGYAEKGLDDVDDNEIVQFERFGFVKIEKNDSIVGIFAHS